MANTTWLGRAAAVVQLDTFTVGGTWVAGDTLSVAINSKAVIHITLSTALTIEDQVDALLALLQASEFGEFSEITWSKVGTTQITGTGPDIGTPFIATPSETSTAGTFVSVTTTNPTGPNWVDDVNNWSAGAVPTTGDVVHIENSSVSLLYGLDNVGGNTLVSLHVAASFLGTIGLPKTNAIGYPEYRVDYLQFDVTTVIIGAGAGSGSSRVKLDMGSVLTSVEVRSTGTEIEQGIPACLVKGTNVGNILSVQTGSVGWSFFGGELGALATLSNVQGNVQTGSDMAQLTTVQNQNGTVSVQIPVTTIDNDAGTLTVFGTATVGTLTVTGGTCRYSSTGTITTLSIGGRAVPAVLDASFDRAEFTVTNTTLHENGTINDPANVITFTNQITLGPNVSSVSAQ